MLHYYTSSQLPTFSCRGVGEVTLSSLSPASAPILSFSFTMETLNIRRFCTLSLFSSSLPRYFLSPLCPRLPYSIQPCVLNVRRHEILDTCDFSLNLEYLRASAGFLNLATKLGPSFGLSCSRSFGKVARPFWQPLPLPVLYRIPWMPCTITAYRPWSACGKKCLFTFLMA